MEAFLRELKDQGFAVDVDISIESRDLFSHDASMFELVPDVILAPKNSDDVKRVVNQVVKTKKLGGKNLSITARSAGTCMSGGSIGQSIVLSMTKYFTQILEVDSSSGHVQPGVYYRDFELETLKHDALMPSYPASRDLCTVGGMVANNSGGEKSLQYGKTEKFVDKLKIVLAGGNEYAVKQLN